jgi:hypothetical protein
MPVSLPRPLVDRLKGGRLGALVNLTARYEVNGRSVLVPVLSGIGFDNLAAYEPWMDRVVALLLRRKPGAFVDVGANLGQTLLKVKTLAPEVPYVGFEPNPVCCHYLEKLIAINRFRSCTVLPVGLSNTAGLVSLHTRTDSDCSGSIVPGLRAPGFG